MKQARCPECKKWSDVEWFDDLPPGGYWWEDNSTGGCPKCSEPICVESECDFRDVESEEKIASWDMVKNELLGGVDPASIKGKRRLVQAARLFRTMCVNGVLSDEVEATKVLDEDLDLRSALLSLPQILEMEKLGCL